VDIQKELLRAQAATMMSVITVAGVFAEVLVRKGLLTADEAAGALCEMAEEIRDDGDGDAGKTKIAAFTVAVELDKRAIWLKQVKK
jgi:hypothetical protein